MVKNRGLFLDRDGVINRDLEYVYRITDIEFIEGIFSLCQAFHDNGYLLFVITNQSGIARRLFSESDLQDLHVWLTSEFERRGIPIAKIYHCPHHPDFTTSSENADCPCRKPAPGMILEAQREFGIDISRSVLIGDKETDIVAGINAGITFNVLLDGGKADPDNTRAKYVIKDLSEILRAGLPFWK